MISSLDLKKEQINIQNQNHNPFLALTYEKIAS